MAKLTPKQERFAAEYLVDLNATKAATRAGYSEKTARSQGHTLLGLPAVQERIQALMAERAERTEVTQDRVIAELAKAAFLDPRQFFNADGTLKEVVELADGSAGALAAMDVYEDHAGVGEDRVKIGETKKLKFCDKLKALELLGKHLGMFKEKVEVSGSVELMAQLMREISDEAG